MVALEHASNGRFSEAGVSCVAMGAFLRKTIIVEILGCCIKDFGYDISLSPQTFPFRGCYSIGDFSF